MRIKRYIKLFIPPIVNILVRKLFKKNVIVNEPGWTGDYKIWEDALRVSGKYEDDIIFEKVKDATRKVLNGEGAFERDTVVFDRLEFSWPLLASLLKIASLSKNHLRIVDFGGSLGSSFHQHKSFLDHLDYVEWNVIEQKHFVEYGRSNLKIEELNFYDGFDSIKSYDNINCVLLSSVLQYLENPFEIIEKVISLGLNYIIIDRTSFIESPTDRLTVQRVPDEIYSTSYPSWFFSLESFIKAFKGYTSIHSFNNNNITPATKLEDGAQVFWQGLLLKKNE